MTKNRIIPLLLTCTVAMMLVMILTGASLKTPETPRGILDLELAHSISRVNVILNAWSPATIHDTDNISNAKSNTGYDFVFILFYSLFLLNACNALAASFTGIAYATGKLLAKAAIVAGVLDIMENIGMLFTLNEWVSSDIIFITAVFAIAKWILVITIVAYLLIALPFYLYRRSRR